MATIPRRRRVEDRYPWVFFLPRDGGPRANPLKVFWRLASYYYLFLFPTDRGVTGSWKGRPLVVPA